MLLCVGSATLFLLKDESCKFIVNKLDLYC